MAQVRVYPNRTAVAHAAAAQFVATAEKAMTTRNRFTVALAGGSTPRDIYRLLAGDEYNGMMEWDLVHVFWGDERAVPLNDPDNNGRMAKEALLNHVNIPSQNIYRIQSQLSPQEAAENYEQTLRHYFGERNYTEPRFDLVMLGLGAEGHTASLFPHSQALSESDHWVTAVYVPQNQSWRISLTPVALNAASKIMFVVVGEEKAQAVKQVLSEPKQPNLLPAQIIDPPQGQVLWIVDKAAALLLEP
jgi:6-phosphogluconolactonase